MAVQHALLATIEDFLWFLIALVQLEQPGAPQSADAGGACRLQSSSQGPASARQRSAWVYICSA